jgi:hypothetical protein
VSNVQNQKQSKLLTEVQKDPSQRSEYPQTKQEEKNNNLEIEQEIECPCNRDLMTLRSDFDMMNFCLVE